MQVEIYLMYMCTAKKRETKREGGRERERERERETEEREREREREGEKERGREGEGDRGERGEDLGGHNFDISDVASQLNHRLHLSYSRLN